jgi:hypothetical protein
MARTKFHLTDAQKIERERIVAHTIRNVVDFDSTAEARRAYHAKCFEAGIPTSGNRLGAAVLTGEVENNPEAWPAFLTRKATVSTEFTEPVMVVQPSPALEERQVILASEIIDTEAIEEALRLRKAKRISEKSATAMLKGMGLSAGVINVLMKATA